MRGGFEVRCQGGTYCGSAGPAARATPFWNGDESDLLPGCWLVTPRRGYTHHGIYIGQGQVVHYAGLAHRWRRGPVEVVTLSEFSNRRQIHIRWTPSPVYVGAPAVQRAMSRIGENRYRIITNNCEHFCAWCVDGLSRSQQVDRWLAPIVEVVRATLGALAHFSLPWPRRAAMVA